MSAGPIATDLSSPDGFWVMALALLAQGERASGAGEVESMQVADMRLKQAQAYASGGVIALVPWAKDLEDLARINDAAGVGRPMGFEDLVRWIGMDGGPKTTTERLEKMILDDRGIEWGTETVARLKAACLSPTEGVRLAKEIRAQLTLANTTKTTAARKARARKRADEKKRAESISNKAVLDTSHRARSGKNKGQG